MADAGRLLSRALADFEARRWRAAIDGFRQAAALDPNLAVARFNLGMAYETAGEVEEAEAVFRGLLGSDFHFEALTRLAIARPESIDDEQLADLQGAAAGDASGRLAFTLGEVLDARGRYDEAFAAFRSGNERTRRREHAAVIQETAHTYQAMAQIFTPELLRFHKDDGHTSNAPIFVVGMPRSGSSLIEQILASHPSVRGIGENSAFAEVVAGRYPVSVRGAIRPNHFRTLAKDYLEATRGQRRRFVDKTLSNDRYVGMIALMFPSAVILHADRNPLDAGLSCFRKRFVVGNEYSTSLEEIGAQYVRHRRLMEHWDRLLPGRVVRISNEALVTSPEVEIPALLAACGLPWDDACLAFHRTVRPVGTASAYQVRRPIFTSSQQKWRRYERHLGPLIAALGPYAPGGEASPSPS